MADPIDPNTPQPEFVPKSEYDTLKSQHEELKQNHTEFVEETNTKLSAMEESLNNALEELAKPKPQTTPDPVRPAPAPIAKPVPVGTEGDSGELEKELDDAIKEDQKFREDMTSFKERIELRDKAIAINNEIAAVIAKPELAEADKTDILLGIEDGKYENDSQQIEKLAKESHDKHVAYKEKIKKQVEDELGQKFKQEQEGNIQVPQSQGTPAANPKPKEPGANDAYVPPASDADEWATALDKARANQGKGV